MELPLLQCFTIILKPINLCGSTLHIPKLRLDGENLKTSIFTEETKIAYFELS